MKIILLQDIKNIGKKDQIINASDGYARNYLIPRKLGIEANNENISKLKARENANKYKKDLEKAEAQEIEKKFKNIVLEITVKAGENGKIFGGVTNKEISEELKKQHKISIDKKKIILSETIKNIGSNIVEVKLYEGINGKLKINIIAEQK